MIITLQYYNNAHVNNAYNHRTHLLLCIKRFLEVISAFCIEDFQELYLFLCESTEVLNQLSGSTVWKAAGL